VINYIPFVTTV